MFFLTSLLRKIIVSIILGAFFSVLGASTTLWLVTKYPEQICTMAQTKSYLDKFFNGK